MKTMTIPTAKKKTMMMTDPRYIRPSKRTIALCDDILDHAMFMDERDARQRDLIRRLAAELAYRRGINGCDEADDDCATCKLLIEARGVEATNE